MKKARQIPIQVLMILSMLLLTGFVGYWLNSQFQEEKKNLENQMFLDFQLSQDQVMDTVLLKYLHPLLKDSVEWQARSGTVATIQIDSRNSSLGRREGQVYSYNSVWETDSLNIGQSEISGSAEEDLLLRGVKLVMKVTTDSIGGEPVFGRKFLAKDSILFKGAFAERVHSSSGKELEIRWLSDSIAVKPSKHAIYLSADHLDPNIQVEIEKVFLFIIKKILPQIAFAWVLILLSGSAFFFTYRSLKKQMLLNTMRNEFISNVSHELKTPVATVKVALEALQNYNQMDDPVVRKEYLSMASFELNRLDRLTQKVLTHAKLEQGGVVLDLEKVDLVSLCKKVLEKMGPRIQEEKASLSFLSSDPSIQVEADPWYLEGVFINLIDNALKYAGPEAVIDIELTSDEQEVRLAVADRGAGIPKAFQKQIFEKFFRIPTQNRHNIKGDGLGLSFAALVLKQHGGSIAVRDRKDGGSVFDVIVPIVHEG